MKKILLFLIFFLSMSFAMEAQIMTPSDYEVCDDNNDGFAIFDLTTKNDEIINGTPGNYTITYHETLNNATQDISPVNTNYANVNQYTTTLYVRVENVTLSTFSIVELNLIVNPLPMINQPNDLIVYQNPYSGVATFDLTIQEASTSQGNPGFLFSYYLTQADAMAGTTQLPPSAYTNVSPTQTIWVRVTNAGTGCFVITDFDIMVLPGGPSNNIYIPDVNFKAKLVQSSTSNTIAKNSLGANMKVDVNNDGEISFSEAVGVYQLNVPNSNIASLIGISSFPNLTRLECSQNQIAILDISSLANLTYFGASQNPLTILDCNSNPNLQTIYIQSPTLEYLLIKNGVNENNFMDPGSWTELFCCSPNLQYVCCDDSQLASVLAVLAELGNTTINVNTYCTVVPGGNYNLITGNAIFDLNNNGCDALDVVQPFIKVNINDGTSQSATFTSNTGNYKFYTQAGNYAITPELDNPSYYTVSPVTSTVNFPTVNNSTETRNFCITPNGIHPDIEIAIAPIVPARPGFPAVYEVVYKNIGNQTLNQQYGISFFYNQNLMSFTSSNPTPETQNAGTLNWSVNNLQPFESRSIYVTMNINAPTATNPVNIDDILTLTANAIPTTGETNTQNNIFQFNQTVVGSYDPNDKQCVEGDIVSPIKIGEYLHYLIRFENTGNYYAENIVVKDVIDATKFDISSLQIMSSSHPVEAKVRGNIAEFIFRNINLDSGGHGNILLKLKTRSNLAVGTTVSNKADIFFDYNHPIITNFANTTFQALSVPENNLNQAIKIYPNPTSDVVNIKADSTIRSIQVYDVQGRILISKILSEENASVDLSSYSSGIYYLKINSDNGSKTEKLIKK